jgi:tetratricopeptide (TPR) repeat protein
MNPSSKIPAFLLSAAFLLSLGYAAQAPGPDEPAPGEPVPSQEAEPVADTGGRVVDAATAADIPYWEEQVAGQPDDVTVRLALGNAYAIGKRYTEAVREYRKVLKDYPEYKSAWNNLGSAYRALGRKSKALDAYNRAVKIDPRYALAYYNIGVIYDIAGEYDRSLEYYATAFKYDPDLMDPRKNAQVVTNRRVFAVLLHNYLETAGTLALPLEPAFPAPEN